MSEIKPMKELLQAEITGFVLKAISNCKNRRFCPLCEQELIKDDGDGFYYCSQGHDETIRRSGFNFYRLRDLGKMFFYFGDKEGYFEKKLTPNVPIKMIFICLAKVK